MKLKRIALPLAGGIVLAACTTAKTIPGGKDTEKGTPSTLAKSDTVKTDTNRKAVRPYKDVITDKAVTDEGLFKVHRVNGRYYFEIPDSLLSKDVLIVNRISKAPMSVPYNNGIARLGYGGDQIGENVVRFEKGPDQKLFIKRVSYLEVSNDSSANGMYRSLYNSNMLSIAASFDIRAFTPDSLASVIDVTDFMKGDNDVLFFHPAVKSTFKLGALQADKSYTSGVLSFPLNVEIKTVKTYIFQEQPVTYELNSSLLLLPAEPMTPRYFDERVGYFSRVYRDFDFPQAARLSHMVTRWRLEPKEEDIERYKKGELVEPKKPIVFYIDPATPKKWVPYLIEGVNAWQKAFEKAGFKNAIYAQEAPVGDSTFSLEDARHSAIIYKASFIENASGPQISDPRSGEILESHINWFHNIQKLLRDQYFLLASPNDPRARTLNFDDTLMGKLIRYVCTHEVGHTLGLRHNFIASASVPVDSLRSRSYVSTYGHTPSIMDYARFNYVAQPEDGIYADDLIPRIGVYDEWAIEWGYKWLPNLKTKEEEQQVLNNWVTEKVKKDKRLLFAAERNFDFRNQMEDLGDDPIKAGYYGVQNLKRVLSHLKEWTLTDNNSYKDITQMYLALQGQFRRYMTFIAETIGNPTLLPASAEKGGPLMTFSPKEKQKEAVKFLDQHLFDNTQWLDEESRKLFPLIGGGNIVETYKTIEKILHQLVSANVYNLLLVNETNQPQETAYSFDELLTDLERGIWKELEHHQSIGMYRRPVQKVYVFKLVNFVSHSKNGDLGLLDGCTVVLDHIHNLYKKIVKALPGYTDNASRIHLSDLRDRLKAAIDTQKDDPGNTFLIPPGNQRKITLGAVHSLFLDSILFFGEGSFEGCWGR